MEFLRLPHDVTTSVFSGIFKIGFQWVAGHFYHPVHVECLDLCCRTVLSGQQHYRGVYAETDSLELCADNTPDAPTSLAYRTECPVFVQKSFTCQSTGWFSTLAWSIFILLMYICVICICGCSVVPTRLNCILQSR